MLTYSFVLLTFMTFATVLEDVGGRLQPVKAVAYYSDGRIENVMVKSRGHYFCHWNCQVDHAHIVHDESWDCGQKDCNHYIVKLIDHSRKSLWTGIEHLVKPENS